MWIVILCVLLVILFLIVGSLGRGKAPQIRRRGIIEFYAKGCDAGFVLSEINLLWKAALQADLSNPPSIYGSVEELGKAINQITGDKKFSDRRGTDRDTLMLGKLFEYRKRIEMSRLKYRSILKSTRNIAVGQRLTIRSDDAGVYSSKVVENEPEYLTITFPVGAPLPPGFSWNQNKLNVYFWRKNDAGYFFQTGLVQRSYGSQRNLLFRVHHSDKILRSQKRRSIRAPVKITARLFLLKNLDQANQLLESNPGLVCLIIDLSEDGAALKMGGRGRKGQALKLQFRIRDEMLVVSGVVKRVHHDSKEDSSILNVEFLPTSENIRMALLSYVFDIDRSRARSLDAENESILNILSGTIAEEEVPVEVGESSEVLSAEGEESSGPESTQEDVKEIESVAENESSR